MTAFPQVPHGNFGWHGPGLASISLDVAITRRIIYEVTSFWGRTFCLVEGGYPKLQVMKYAIGLEAVSGILSSSELRTRI